MRHLAGSFCSLGLGLSALCHAVMADSQPQNAGRDAFVFRNVQQADDHFAVALRSQQQGMTIERHLVLIDTSASQTGKFRSDSLELLKSLGSTLPQNHLVQVVAVDSTFAPLSEGFVKPGSPEFAASFRKLSERTPMGATDLLASLTKAVALDNSDAPTSLLYIGDGKSTSNLLSSDDLTQVVRAMRDTEISFHALLLGPGVDTELPGILANQTGGTSQHPGQIVASKVALSLSDAISIAPEFVSNLESQDSDLTLASPEKIALRSDRHTLVFGKGKPAQNLTLAAVDAAGNAVNWTTSGSASTCGNEVGILFERAAASHGMNSPVVGIEGFQAVSAELAASVNRSIVTAKQLAENGENSRALDIARRASILAGGDVRLTALIDELGAEIPPVPADDVTPGASSAADNGIL
jgi:hypothetical protein